MAYRQKKGTENISNSTKHQKAGHFFRHFLVGRVEGWVAGSSLHGVSTGLSERRVQPSLESISLCCLSLWSTVTWQGAFWGGREADPPKDVLLDMGAKFETSTMKKRRIQDTRGQQFQNELR